ncbi:hypothetical protein ACN6K9_005836, partial [Streptomyces sp. SAS_267]|uniref:hypothetical protein n=1 Tax=Streptomyces sp. SAS_267 TaxID=3412750 RepID=UPI00403C0551
VRARAARRVEPPVGASGNSPVGAPHIERARAEGQKGASGAVGGAGASSGVVAGARARSGVAGGAGAWSGGGCEGMDP